MEQNFGVYEVWLMTAHENDFSSFFTHYLLIYFQVLMLAYPMRRLTIITIHFSREHNITAVTLQSP